MLVDAGVDGVELRSAGLRPVVDATGLADVVVVVALLDDAVDDVAAAALAATRLQAAGGPVGAVCVAGTRREAPA